MASVDIDLFTTATDDAVPFKMLRGLRLWRTSVGIGAALILWCIVGSIAVPSRLANDMPRFWCANSVSLHPVDSAPRSQPAAVVPATCDYFLFTYYWGGLAAGLIAI